MGIELVINFVISRLKSVPPLFVFCILHVHTYTLFTVYTGGVLVVVLHTAGDLNMRGKEREKEKERGEERRGRRGGERRARPRKERERGPTTVPELTELEMGREREGMMREGIDGMY